MAIEISLILTVFNLLGFGGIVSALVVLWFKNKQEFMRVKKCIILELKQNLQIASEIVSFVNAHTFPVPLLREEAWRILLSSGQLKKFGGERVEDPIRELSYIYSKIAVINQTILSRHSLIFGSVRAMGKLYQKTLFDVDAVIKQNTVEIVRLMKRTKRGLQQKDIIEAFRNPAFFAE
jgi:hypothetical protein